MKKGHEWGQKEGVESRLYFPVNFEYHETHLGDMVYKQRGVVKYADYRVGKCCICPGFVPIE